MIVFWILLFIVSMFFLIKASDIFIDAAEIIGNFLGFSHFIVGVFLVGIGTSLPELFTSIIAVLDGSSEIVVGNVLGSNVTNIFLVLGVAAVLGKRFDIEYDLMRIDLPILLGSSFLIGFMIWDGQVTIMEAVVCLVCLAIYITSTFYEKVEKEDFDLPKPALKDWLLLFLSPVFIYLGAKYLIFSVIQISADLNLGKEIIALSAIALGTSLPEVFVAIAAVRKGKPEMAVGNVIGSNIFNSLAVVGFPTLIAPLIVSPVILTFALPMSIAATMLCLIITIDKTVNIWHGVFLLVFYFYFIGKLYGLI